MPHGCSHASMLTISYLCPVLGCSGSLPHCKPVYKHTTLFLCPGIASSCSSLLLSAQRRPWKGLPAQLLRQDGCLGWVSNVSWLRTGAEEALSLGWHQKEPSQNPGAAAGLRGAGAAFAGSLSPAGSDPAVSAGCLLQHQQRPQRPREPKSWLSQPAVVLPVLGGEEMLIPLLELSHR